MTAQPDDDKLTAYALGELDGPERAEVEARILTDPAVRQAVEEIRQVAGMLGEQLQAEPAPKLTDLQRARIEAEARRPSRIRPWWASASVAAAAIVLIGLTTAAIWGGVGRWWRQDDGPGAKPSVAVETPGAGVDANEFPGPEPISTPEDVGPGDWKDKTPGEPKPFMRRPHDWDREGYSDLPENPFHTAADKPLSTFAADVDTASYANVRRMLLREGRWPVAGAVRIEEMVNYFPYDYAGPLAGDEHPLAVHTDLADCPWNAEHRLLRVAIKARDIAPASRPGSNLVFLLDVSDSMNQADKLPYVKKAMAMLLDRLDRRDRVAIVVYAAATGLVLDSTPCDRKQEILAAMEDLHAGGGTDAGAGIHLAYATAGRHFIEGGVNRVIFCTDGDFNVGVTEDEPLGELIRRKAKTGVFLTALGFGTGDYQDDRMERLADKGNGNYAYIDTLAEARKVLVDQMRQTLVTVAKDVKIQVEFNPAEVAAYRLIGYANRRLAEEDFSDRAADGGEIGAGRAVTALYEIVPAGQKAQASDAPSLRYQSTPRLTAAAASGEICTVRLRYKAPDAETPAEVVHRAATAPGPFEKAPADLRFAAAVAGFGMVLRDSEHKGQATLDAVLEQARSALGDDEFGYRAEFIELVRRAAQMRKP